MDSEDEFHKRLTAEQIAQIKLKIVRTEKPSWFSRDRVEWQSDEGREGMEIPNGLDEAGALICVRIYEAGRERGMDDGREEIRAEFRELLGAAKSD